MARTHSFLGPVRTSFGTGHCSPLVWGFVFAAMSVGCSAPADSAPTANSNQNGLGPDGSGSGASIAPGQNGSIQVEDTAIVVDDGPVLPAAGAGDDCDSLLEVTYRDFDESHPDFEPAFAGDVVRLELLEPALGVDQKPVFKSSIGCPPSKTSPQECDNWLPTGVTIESATSFDQWYRTVEGVNHEKAGTLSLTEMPAGSGTYVYDTAQFFPLEPSDGFGVTPAGNHLGKNFLFTTEIHLLFSYVKGQKFEFRGDDDLWIFVNNTLALDLGSMHEPAEGVIDFDAQATALGITPGGSYSMDIFHAERHTTGSNFRIETNIACFTPVKISVPR